jgi:hypothetical protein
MTSSSIADTGIKFVDIVGKVAGIALRLERGAESVADALGPLAGLIPYLPQVQAVMRIADPIIEKIATMAPAVHGLIEAGRPAIEVAQAVAPAVLGHFKDLLAIALTHEPFAFNPALARQAISDAQAFAFAGLVLVGRPWTAEETQRWNDKATGAGW